VDPADYGSRDDRLFKLLESADVVVVDGSANSMGYMYSLGVRHALSDKPTIVFVEEHFVPFDVTIWRGVHHIRSLVAGFEPQLAREWLAGELRNAGTRKSSSYSPVIAALENVPRVFLSYAHDDRHSVAAVDQWLRDRGARAEVDERSFIAGRDIRDEIVRLIERAGKVVCFYSKSSKDRYYPKLERRLAEEIERQHESTRSERVVLVYFRLDATPLPPESLYRLAINAWGMSFEDACIELWRNLVEKPAEPLRI
jgi:hypothetical protein